MTKKNVMPVVVLTSICVVVALLLAVVNMFTAPVIKANAERAELESLKEVMPDATGFETVTAEGLPESVDKIQKETSGQGFVVLLKKNTNYSHGTPISITVGIGSDGKITGIKLTGYSESKDIGADYPGKFTGLDASSASGVDTVSGVTISSTAFKSLVADAFAAAALVGGSAPDSSLADVNSLLPEGESAAEVSDAPLAGGALRVWKSTASNNYVVLVNTKTQYVNPDTSTLVAVDASTGKITGIKILEWKHGTNVGYTDAFVNAFTGKDGAGVDGIDTVTDATGTSENVKSAAKDAISTVTLQTYAAAYREAKALLGADFVTLVHYDAASDVKCAWQSDGGALAIVVNTKTQYVNPDTSTVVAVGLDSKVIGIKILEWNHGEGIGYTDEFVNAFTGKDSAGVDGIDAITGATGTGDNVKSAVKAAITWAQTKIDEHYTALAGKLIKDSVLESVSAEGAADGVKRIWRDTNGGGYVVLVNTKTQYVDPDTSTLVAVGNDGKVIDIEILEWKHGEGIGFTDEFVGAFAGKDDAAVDGVDVITGATGTSANIKSAVKTAIAAVSILKGGN